MERLEEQIFGRW